MENFPVVTSDDKELSVTASTVVQACGGRLPQWYKRVENNPFTEPVRELLAQKGTKLVPESQV